ncbi:MAG: sulfatase-like hydrolase/transferase, partial [Lachnospiraceae bacterium]
MKFKKEKSSQVLYWILIAVGLNVFIESLARLSISNLLNYIFFTPLIFIYNTLIIMVTLSFAFLVKRRTFAVGLISTIWMVMGIVNGVLLGFHIRTTPLTAQDLKMYKFALSLADNYLSFGLIVLLIMVVASIIAVLMWIWKRAPISEGKIAYMKTILFIVVFTFGVLCMNELGMRTGILAKNFGNIQQAYQDYGFPYCFANSLLNTGIDKPSNYDKNAVEDIVDKEVLDESATVSSTVAPSGSEATGDLLGEERKDTNIIFIQLESLFDVTKMKDLEFSKDPLPNLTRLRSQFSSGYVSVPSVGAGTANTEFEVITGMNLDFFGPGEYPYKTVLMKTTAESVAYNMSELGYKTHAIHNNNATFYDRVGVFPRLGFETFTSIEYMNNLEYTQLGWAKDKVLIDEIKKALDSTEEKDLIYTISVQGHGSYPEEAILENPEITITGGLEDDESRKNAFTYYVNQIYEMDQFIGTLIDTLSATDEKYVVVMYGDHLPTLGITEDELDGTNLFQTPYVIWNNFNLPKVERNVEAYQLSAHVLNQLDIHKGILTRFHQKYLLEGSVEPSTQNVEEESAEEKYLNDLKVIEYD